MCRSDDLHLERISLKADDFKPFSAKEGAVGGACQESGDDLLRAHNFSDGREDPAFWRGKVGRVIFLNFNLGLRARHFLNPGQELVLRSTRKEPAVDFD